MKKFNIVQNGYDPKEVSEFVDTVIKKIEILNKELIDRENNVKDLIDKINKYDSMENTLNKAIISAQEAGEKMKELAKTESLAIIEEAKRNANTIISEALLQTEKLTYESMLLRKNLKVFKHRIKNVLASQLELAEDLDTLELEENK